MGLHMNKVMIFTFVVNSILHGIDSQNPVLTTNTTTTVSEFQSVTLTCHHNADIVKWWRGTTTVLLIAFGTPCTYTDPRPDYMNCECSKPNYTCVIPSMNMSFDKIVWKCSDSSNVFSNEIIFSITELKTDTTTTTTTPATSPESGLTDAEKGGIGAGCGAGCVAAGAGLAYCMKKKKEGEGTEGPPPPGLQAQNNGSVSSVVKLPPIVLEQV